MRIETLEQQKREGGFTLVELAIVMIIIGLLIGGILKGQELIANSQVTATVAQIKGIDAAVSTFRDKYAALPGDMTNANTRLANCTAAPCTGNGDQDGRIEGGGATAGGTAPTGARESVRAFAHLSAADLLSGIDANAGAGAPAFGLGLPEAKLGGGFTGIEFSSAGALSSAAVGQVGHYLILTGSVSAVNAASATLVPARAAQIDRKLDDGDSSTGAVRGTTTAGGCSTAAGVYDEDSDAGNERCSMYFRIQG